MTKDEIKNKINELKQQLSDLEGQYHTILGDEEEEKNAKIRASMTHVGLICGRKVYLRETRLYFVSEYGDKYKKHDATTAYRCGYSVWESGTWVKNIRQINVSDEVAL